MIKKYSILAIVLLSLVLTIVATYIEGKRLSDNQRYESRIDSLQTMIDNLSKITDTLRYHSVLATKYNAVKEQCNSQPNITADNSKIDFKLLNNYKLRWLAVSRDLLSHFNYGDTIIVNCDNPNLNGEWVIRDTMNKRFTNRIDFLVPLNDTLDFHTPINVIIRKK